MIFVVEALVESTNYCAAFFPPTRLETRPMESIYRASQMQKLFSGSRKVLVKEVNFCLIHCLLVVKHARGYPKDGELYLARTKTGETQLEARTNTNVQIVS